jgi:formate dehydrogenase major subunit
MNTGSPQVTITIDGRQCSVEDTITVLEAARRNDIPIPTLCHHPALSSWGGCRLCLVEVDGSPKLVASCVTPVRNGMSVVTTNAAIIESRKTILEFLFAERNHNCMICAQSGDCELQKLAYDLGIDHVSVPFSFKDYPVDITSEHMALDHNRCVLCGRCIRACHEIAGAGVLGFHNRGPKSMVGLDLLQSREESSCLGCGACLQVCPTGALTNRYQSHYAVKGHGDERIATSEGDCPLCGFLCPTVLETRDGRLTKVDGKFSCNGKRPDNGQLCSKGRFELFKDPGARLLYPMQRNFLDEWEVVSWDWALANAASRLLEIKKRDGGEALFGWTSSMASNEELLLFREMMKKSWSAGVLDSFDGAKLRGLFETLGRNGSGPREDSWKRIAAADMLLVAGDPFTARPMLLSLARKKQQAEKAFVALIGPPPALAARGIRYQLALEGEAFGQVAKALCLAAQAAAKTPRKDPAKASAGRTVSGLLNRAGLDEGERGVFDAIVTAYATAKNPVIVMGETTAGMVDRSALSFLKDMAALKTDSEKEALGLIIAKPTGNSAGAWRMGVCDTEPKMSKKKIRGGIIRLSGNQDAGQEAVFELGQLEFLTVFSPYVPEKIKSMAHVLIPIPTWLETAGSYLSIDGLESAYRQAVIAPPPGVPPLWQTMGRLAELAGRPLAGSMTWEELREQVEAVLADRR